MKALFFLALIVFTSPSFAQSLEEGKREFDAQNFETAFKILKPLADEGDAQALTYIAHMYLEGWGVDEDIELGCDMFEKAAKMGEAEAQSYAGLCYMGSPGRWRQPNRAYKWMNKGYEGGSRDAVMPLASVALLLGYEKQSYSLFLDEAQSGNGLAMNMVGTFYRDGRHVEKNFTTACDWFEKSANAGNADGIYHLGLCLFHGEGRPQDKEAAFHKLKSAAKLGDEDAVEAVKKLRELGFKD